MANATKASRGDGIGNIEVFTFVLKADKDSVENLICKACCERLAFQRTEGGDRVARLSLQISRCKTRSVESADVDKRIDHVIGEVRTRITHDGGFPEQRRAS